jgi:hypothetical protein
MISTNQKLMISTNHLNTKIVEHFNVSGIQMVGFSELHCTLKKIVSYQFGIILKFFQLLSTFKVIQPFSINSSWERCANLESITLILVWVATIQNVGQNILVVFAVFHFCAAFKHKKREKKKQKAYFKSFFTIRLV